MEEEGAGMPPRRSASLHPQIQVREEGAGVARRRSTRRHPQIEASEHGTGMPPRRSPRLHPQIEASEEGAGVTCRRRRGTSTLAPESLPFNDDMLREILIRLPPQPSSLPRASAVCKRWLGLLTDPKFISRFRDHHRKPPLLGVFPCSFQRIVFTPVLDPPDRIPPQRFDLGRYSSDGYDCALLDCRHGRVLIEDQMQNGLVVCDPITGEQRCVAVPSELKSGYLEGAVLCTAGDHGHVHGGCQSSSYKVVLVSTGKRSDNKWLACVYSLETGVWGNIISVEAGYEPFFAQHIPATLIGNCLYWSKGDDILKFGLDRQNLAVIMGPPGMNDLFTRQIIQAANGSIGCAILSYPRLEMWQRNINGHGVATWVVWKTIEMHTIHGLPTPDEGMRVQLLGYEDDVVFLCYKGSVYIVQLKSMQSRKLDEIHCTGNHCFPFRSFFTPAIAGGFNGAEMLHIG